MWNWMRNWMWNRMWNRMWNWMWNWMWNCFFECEIAFLNVKLLFLMWNWISNCWMCNWMWNWISNWISNFECESESQTNFYAAGWLEKAELKPTQPSLAGAWLSLAKKQKTQMSIFPLYNVKAVVPCLNGSKFAIIYHISSSLYFSLWSFCLLLPALKLHKS